jgi:hypothetical protein
LPPSLDIKMLPAAAAVARVGIAHAQYRPGSAPQRTADAPWACHVDDLQMHHGMHAILPQTAAAWGTPPSKIAESPLIDQLPGASPTSIASMSQHPPPTDRVVGEESGRLWLARAKAGTCGVTAFNTGCAGSIKGSWTLGADDKLEIRRGQRPINEPQKAGGWTIDDATKACLARCAKCGPCAHISVSVSPAGRGECDWFASCTRYTSGELLLRHSLVKGRPLWLTAPAFVLNASAM